MSWTQRASRAGHDGRCAYRQDRKKGNVMRALSLIGLLCVIGLSCGCRSLDSQGRIVNVVERVSEGHPRGCAEFYMDPRCKDEAWVRDGWDSFPFGNRGGYNRDATSVILRIFAAPGPNVFRIGPRPFIINQDWTIMISDQMITPVRVFMTREQASGPEVTVKMTGTPEKSVPMEGKIDQKGREIRAIQDNTPPQIQQTGR